MTYGTEPEEGNEQPIAEFMTRVAALPVTVTLPDPMYVWWKAHFLQRRDEERRARLPIDVVHPIEIAAGLFAAVWLFYSSLSYLFRAYAG
jgi:hypothetical protein